MKIVLTIGDPNGIGIEIMCKALASIDLFSAYPDVQFIIAGNSNTIINYCRLTDIPAECKDDAIYIYEKKYELIECNIQSEIEFGKVTSSAGTVALEAINKAVKETLSGNCDAVVTMPISKESIHLAGSRFPGHTEYITSMCGAKESLMILLTKELYVALATVHISLKLVPFKITIDKLLNKLMILDKTLINDFAKKNPKIALLGLNPHSGENGTLGTEEIDIIIPAMKKANESGMNTFGPFSADGFFAHGNYKNFDAVLSMYHDQGLTPLKIIAAGKGVNFTAGLPIVRTSPDHGTAFGLAGKGKAEEFSAIEAIKTAILISSNRKKN